MLIFPSDIPVYVINLKRSRDRRQYMEELCARYQITAQFIEAVDGRLLSSTEVSRYTDQEKARRCIYRELIDTEIGCALSHRKVYQKIVTDGVPYGLVLEDDVEFDEQLVMVVRTIRDIQKPWDLILLGYTRFRKERVALNFWHRVSLIDRYILGHPVQLTTGAYGYLISQQGARQIVEESDPLYQPIDHYTGDYRRKLLLVSPPIVRDHAIVGSDSSIGARDFRRERLSAHIQSLGFRASFVQRMLEIPRIYWMAGIVARVLKLPVFFDQTVRYFLRQLFPYNPKR